MCRNVQRYPLIQEKAGYSEQNPEDWVQQTIEALAELVSISNVQAKDIDGISYSGQMHGLVLLDQDRQVLRNAILWNDTRTTPQCIRMTEKFGDHLLDITKNRVLEGFTLPKMLWVKEHEPELFKNCCVFASERLRAIPYDRCHSHRILRCSRNFTFTYYSQGVEQ